MVGRFIALMASLALFCGALTLNVQSEESAEVSPLTVEQRESFEKKINPLLAKACGNCHGKEPKDNDLDLTSFDNAHTILAKPKVLGDVAERLRLGDMPPKDAPQISEAERELLLGWINSALDTEAAARAGDTAAYAGHERVTWAARVTDTVRV